VVKPGTKVTLSVWRKGASRDLAVTVAEMKEESAGPQQRRSTAPKEKAKPNRMGLMLSDLTDEQKKTLELKSVVVVEDIATTFRGNVQAGDIILAIINKGVTTEVRSVEQVNTLVAKLEKGASIALRMKRGEQQFLATIRLSSE